MCLPLSGAWHRPTLPHDPGRSWPLGAVCRGGGWPGSRPHSALLCALRDATPQPGSAFHTTCPLWAGRRSLGPGWVVASAPSLSVHVTGRRPATKKWAMFQGRQHVAAEKNQWVYEPQPT